MMITVQVDIKYSKELCKSHYDYTLAPNKRKSNQEVGIEREILSDYRLKIVANYIYLILYIENSCS